MLWGATPHAVSAADDYLSILEEEANSTGNVANATVTESSPKAPVNTNVGENEVIAPGLSFEEFEAVLESQYSGSHYLYIRLSGRDRQKVYRSYQDDNRISSVREVIVRLLSAG